LTWTYSGDPASSDRDRVRFEIGDTDTTDQQLTDAEIDAALALYASSVTAAAIYCANALVAKFSRLCDQSVGAIHVSYSQRASSYKTLVAELRRRGGAASPYLGGRSLADKDTVEGDTDRSSPAFSRGMLDRKY